MPYVKPELMLEAQEAIEHYSFMLMSEGDGKPTSLSGFMDICPVCGNVECSKDIVKVNGVYIHPEDAQDADRIPQPTLGGDR